MHTSISWRETDRFSAQGSDGFGHVVVELTRYVTFHDRHRTGQSTTIANATRYETSPEGRPVMRVGDVLTLEGTEVVLVRE